MMKILRNCAVKVGHECFKRDGTVGMFFAVEDCWYPGKHWNSDDESRQHRSDFEFNQVWHFTRDPRKSIPSIASAQLPGAVWCWQERHTGISAGLYPKTLRAMKFWVAWNALIEKNEKVDLFFRIEDIDAHWSDMCARLGLGQTEMPEIERTYGTAETGPRRTVPMSWDEMLDVDAPTAEAVKKMAERYGYDLTTPLEVS